MCTQVCVFMVVRDAACVVVVLVCGDVVVMVCVCCHLAGVQ